MAKKLYREFSQAFSGLIWRIEADSSPHYLGIELRDPRDRSVKFALLDTEKPEVRWELPSPAADFHTGLLAMEGGVMVIHNYTEKPDPSAEDGIFVLDAATGEVTWELEHVRFVNLRPPHHMLIYSTVEDGHPLLLVDLSTGEMEYLEGQDLAEVQNTFVNTDNNSLSMPLHYPEENTHFGTFREYISKSTGNQAVKEVEYAEWGDCLVISYYLYVSEKLDNFLLVTDREGTVLLHESLASGLDGLASDTFFLYSGKLIFIKDKNILQVYVQ